MFSYFDYSWWLHDSLPILNHMLQLLSLFSCVQLCATPQTAAHQASLSLGFSRQEYWGGLSFPSPIHACMLSHFSHVRLCVTPQMAAHQAPLSLGFSRQEYWSGLPFPSPMHTCMLSRFSHVQLCYRMDSSPPDSSVHRILQARILEWVAIFFSKRVS